MARAPHRSSVSAQLRLCPQEPRALLLRAPCPAGTLPGHVPALWGPPPLLWHLPAQAPVWFWGPVSPSLWDGTAHRDTAQGCVWCRAPCCQAPGGQPPSPPALPQPIGTGCPLTHHGAPPCPGDPNPHQHRDPQTKQHSLSGAVRGSPRGTAGTGAARAVQGWLWDPHPSTLHAPLPLPLGAVSPSQQRPWLGAGQRAGSCGDCARGPAGEGPGLGRGCAGAAGRSGTGLRGWRHVSISHGRVNGSPHTSQRRQGQLRTRGVRSDTSANGPGIPRLLPPARSGASLGELRISRWAQGHPALSSLPPGPGVLPGPPWCFAAGWGTHATVETPPEPHGAPGMGTGAWGSPLCSPAEGTAQEVLGGPEMGLETWGSPPYTPAAGTPPELQRIPGYTAREPPHRCATGNRMASSCCLEPPGQD
ncbi:collagen alpha-2(I) chain-like [Poecile atricapillus]|uniref:collagen alpha-2(I) chain-like n=1 Tax=Poecile atricapillus TaxID=48891 RepID=UPI00273956BA|nr:collagen alpha-2(I) chain-like [Poecile atricapillus]